MAAPSPKNEYFALKQIHFLQALPELEASQFASLVGSATRSQLRGLLECVSYPVYDPPPEREEHISTVVSSSGVEFIATERRHV